MRILDICRSLQAEWIELETWGFFLCVWDLKGCVPAKFGPSRTIFYHFFIKPYFAGFCVTNVLM